MIAELLDRQFVVDQLEQLQRALRAEAQLIALGDPAASQRADETETTLDDLHETMALVSERLEAEAARPQTDDTAPFFPGDAVMGLAQSALHRFYEREDMIERPTGAGLLALDVPITNVTLRGVGPQGATKKLFEQFSQTDVGWASCLLAKGVRFFRRKRRFTNTPPPVCPISSQARIALVSDWGTGVPRAQRVAQAVRAALLEAKADGRDAHVIHLGDVYYSGWANEYDDHFLAYWPVLPGEERAFTSWCLNANHDMFSGGRDYFDHLLADARFSKQGRASFFGLENADWQIVGLDTAYDEYDLHGGQAAWASQLRAKAPGKKGIFLSHHQLWSAYGRGSPNVEAKLHPVLSAGQITAWFWGHEHRCVLYAPRSDVRFGRCIGHGGVPVWAESGALPDGVQWQYRDFLKSGFETFARFGFIVLDFNGPSVHVEYRGEDGKMHNDETIA